MTYINNIEPQNYLAGQIADSNPYSILSLPNTGSLTIPFGIAMTIDGTTEGYQLPTVIGDVNARMAVCLIINRNKFYQYDSNYNPLIIGNTGVPVGQEAAGMTEGSVAVLVEQAVVAGQPVYIRYAAGAGGTQLGAFRGDVDTASAALQPNWYYQSSAAAQTYAIVAVK